MAIPIWRTGAFAGEFCDAYLENTELEGGKLGPSCRSLAALLRTAAGTSDIGTQPFSSVRSRALHDSSGFLYAQNYFLMVWSSILWS